ncbi:MAG: chitobiase/beta-hexosaminidase C-terminal domain-containing protein [Deltaproteobacteria bacterium]|nr:chitobiase/beta-hexosaminidase C-terminal domain-containing protein [Deltaproteobacteria bacterium]
MKQISFALLVGVTLLQSACGGGNDFPDAAPPGDVAAVIPNTTISPKGQVVRSRDITLTADVAATIYYTLDGTEPTTASANGASPATVTLPPGGAVVRYFAVSSTGGTETSKSETFTVDRLGPQAIDNLQAVATGPDIALTWTNPTAPGFTDVVLVRTSDVAATVPTDFAALAVGDSVGPGTVVYVGPGTSFTHAAAGAGSSTYVAWARFANGVYAEGRTASAYVEPPAQLATISIDITGATGTVTTQPGAYTLSIANVSNATAGQVTFDVTATTTLRGITFAPKLVQKDLTITDDTSIDLVADGTLGTTGTTKVVALGTALPAAGTLTRTVTMTTTGTGTITFDVEVVHSPGVFSPTWNTVIEATYGGAFADFGSTVEIDALPTPTPWENSADQYGQYRGLIVSPDGRWIYAGQRASGKIVKLDATTGQLIGGTDLAPAVAGNRVSTEVTLDPSGHRLYVVFNDGMHGGARTATTATLPAPQPTTVSSYLLEIDPATMTEVGRMSLQTDVQALHVARNFALSRDGRVAAVPLSGAYSDADDAGVGVIDLSAMTLRDGDSATAGTQLVATPGRRPSRCAFTWTAASVVCANSGYSSTGDRVTVIDTATLAASEADQDGEPTTSTQRYKTLVPLTDGTVALAGVEDAVEGGTEGTPLMHLDPATKMITAIGTVPLPQTIAGVLVGTDLVMRGRAELFKVDLATGTETRLHDLAASSVLHTLGATPF